MLETLLKELKVSRYLVDLCTDAYKETKPYREKVAENCAANFLRVQGAFRQYRLNSSHFQTTNGYGYHDLGREKMEECLAAVFGAEKAFFRQQIVSGTHAIALGLKACLQPGDELIYATGTPYDTLLPLITPGYPGSLCENGITCRTVSLDLANQIDTKSILDSISSKTKVIAFQRSSGYKTHSAFSLSVFKEVWEKIKKKSPEVIIFVDNCYGEFVDTVEPTMIGADLMAGSFLKNPGGTIAPGGGYLAGKKHLIENVETAFFSPGLHGIGPSLISNRLYFQGLYLAPLFVRETLQGIIFLANLLARLGMNVFPRFDEKRSDIIQGVILGSKEKMIRFCRMIQENSPVESYITPQPAEMPGYDHEIIMAGGTFVAGSSMELSADGPVKDPYAVFLQGGFYQEQIMIAGIRIAEKIIDTKDFL